MKKVIIATVIFLLSVAPFAMAVNRLPGDELLEEIDIMEAVLSRLIKNNKSGIPYFGSNARGFYLSDYGVIFDVAHHVNYGVAFSFTTPELPEPPEVPSVVLNGSKGRPLKDTDDKEQTSMNVITRSKVRTTRTGVEDETDKNDKINEIKKSLTTFFTKYAPSMSGLKSDEKITVLLDLNGYPFTTSYKKGNLPQQFFATLPMADITDYKKNKISKEELKKRIDFNEIESVDEDVSIFSNVIQTSLSRVKKDSGFGFDGNVKSIRIKGHGIVFMLDADAGVPSFKILNENLKDLEKKLKVMSGALGVTSTKSSSGKGETRSIVALGTKTDDFKEYEEKLIQIISKYGHTLSELKTKEYVGIAVRFNNIGTKENFSKCIIKVKKADIDDFNKGKIDFDNFRKKVDVVYY